jgi:hypothetical protein
MSGDYHFSGGVLTIVSWSEPACREAVDDPSEAEGIGTAAIVEFCDGGDAAPDEVAESATIFSIY